MESVSHSHPELIPLFLGQRGRNVSFVLDTSEDMGTVLGSVKRLLIQTLLTKASLRDSLFNILGFSYKTSRWSDRMLPCAPDTVYEALPWIHALGCSPGRDLRAALGVALSDPACQAVHLVTGGGLPDHPEALLRALPTVTAGRPLAVFYLSDPGSPLDSRTRDFLQCLAHATGGSCCVVPVGADGALEQAIPLYSAQSKSSVPVLSTANSCGHSASVVPLLPDRLPTLLRCTLGNPFCPVTSCVLRSGRAVCTSDFLPGCRVLARRELDGLYRLGTVTQEVQGRRGLYVVDFDTPGGPEGGGAYARVSQQQLVCSPDMVNHTHAHTHCLVPGDTVLSPWEPDLRRYGPGRVLSGMERRDLLRGTGPGLQVLMWNGRMTQVPGDLAVWIPASHHERIVGELQRLLPPSSSCCHGDVLCAPSVPGVPPLPSCCAQRCPSLCVPCHCPIIERRPLAAPPPRGCGLREGEGLGRAELEKKVDLQLEELKDTEAETSSAPSEDEARSLSPESHPGGPDPDPDRPPWRYWRRSPPEPQHRQPGKAAKSGFQPAKFSHCGPQTSITANRSSLFQPLPGSARRVTMGDVIGQTNPKPQPPKGLQSVCIYGNRVTAIYT